MDPVNGYKNKIAYNICYANLKKYYTLNKFLDEMQQRGHPTTQIYY